MCISESKLDKAGEMTDLEAKRLEELEVERNTWYKVGNGERAGLTYEEWDELFTLRKKKEAKRDERD